MSSERAQDIAVVGAGAAGLMSAISAGRAARDRGARLRICAIDGARTLGAKILVAGGGRCNVTHDVVDPKLYAGSSTGAVRKVLGRFSVADTTRFFGALGVTLKREETGKLFPTTDKARTVLDALLRAAREAGVELVYPWRVWSVEQEGDGFVIRRAGAEFGDEGDEVIRARRVILCTGGKSLPRSGSDGHGHGIAKSLGHSVTARVFPALAPLVINHARSDWLKALSGLTTDATLEVRSSTGKRIKAVSGSLLCTHFGLSGPCAMDISRYYTDARMDDAGAVLVANWVGGATMDDVDRELQTIGAATVGRYFSQRARSAMPARLIEAVCAQVGVEAGAPGHSLTREQRKALARALAEMVIEIHSDRGWNYAEVTAGGVPLDEIDLKTMESKITRGLYFAGEICDVDGPIGGYNFQWAWASGFVAGTSTAATLQG